MQSTRQEHMDWCKQRALDLVDVGDTQQAFQSFLSDVQKHQQTKEVVHLITSLGMPLLMGGFLNSPEEMRKHIQGYN